MLPASIVDGVRYPEGEGMVGWYGRRNHDFFGPWGMPDRAGQLISQVSDAMAAAGGTPDLTLRAGGADRFLNFLGQG
ncbi:hypothetical protein [Marmoricola sp. RAF53]|uniref:hypothetical protein n=1 Tax=Marmoricola sp. RAF53 TaxID=3233059 RepID=UPI003F9D152F